MRLLNCPSRGMFVDVGAHHPFRFSNTYAFYLRGWRGLNIDATPGAMRKFRRWRPGDTNLECGIGNAPGEFEFYQFAEPALNTFDPALAQTYREAGHAQVGKTSIRCRTLVDVLAEHLAGRVIDSLTGDVEGRDMEVLLSNNRLLHDRRLEREALAY
jgi:FkbM family methyltransferase